MQIEFEYAPRDLFLPYHQRNARWSAIVAHRRAGKTVACINDLIARAIYTQKTRPRYSYIAPYYSQAKEIAWAYLKAYAGQAVRKASESSLTVELFNDAKISLFGADNPDALRGVYNDGVILDEYGDCRPSLWGEVILPTLADRRGWATFIGSAKGKNHFYEVVKRSRENTDWYHATLKASETGIIPEEELAELKLQMSEEQYAQEMECDFSAAVLGTYYAKIISTLELKEQIYATSAAYDPNQPVSVAADLGYTDSTSLWFWQLRPDGIAVIDYEEAHGEPLSYYFSLLNSKPYEFDAIWLPHDARAKSLQTGRSTVEQFAEAFPDVVRIAPTMRLQHGVDAARLVLPHCWFHPATAEGVEGLRAYRRRWDENKKIFSDQPVHDWASHPADAFRYMALVCRTALPGQPEEDPSPHLYLPRTGPEYRLDELFSERERGSRFSRARI
jgi:hypothetical protein